MQMSILVKAVAYIHMFHLIICLNTDNWKCENILRIVPYKSCSFEVPSLSLKLSVLCRKDELEISKNILDSGNPLKISNTHFPSLKHLWMMCMYGDDGLTAPNGTSVNLSVKLLNTGITMLPDDYFCNWPTIAKITILEGFLTDTTKLGFNPLQTCDTSCITEVTTYRIILNARGNNFKKISRGSFCGLDLLGELFLGHCEIKELESDAFVHLKSLRFLELNDNHISMLPPGVFRKQEGLLGLRLSNNHLGSSSLVELRNLNQLTTLLLNGNRISVLPDGVFDGMSGLNRLDLGNNSLKTLQGALNNLTKIRSLTLSSNSISVISSEDFKNMVKLQNIYLSNNPIIEFDPEAFINSYQLRHIEFSNALLSTVPLLISKAKYMKYLELSHNEIGEIKIGAFDAAFSINLIDLSFNNITVITEVFTWCSVKNLILDYNRLSKLSFLDFSSHITELSITHNEIHTIDSAFTFNSQKWALKALNLSYNHFVVLKDVKLPASVSTFDVRNNKIKEITYSEDYIQLMTIGGSFGLSKLYLQNNEIQVLCPNTILSDIPLESYFKGNPLRCSCENVWLLLPFKHVNLKQSKLADFNTLTCEHEFQRLGNQSRLMTLDTRDFLCNSMTGCSCNNAINRQYFQVETCSVVCPMPCECYSNYKASLIHIDCSSKDFIDLPLTHMNEFDHTGELHVYLDNNSIAEINCSSFLGLNKTIALYLNQTGLREMEDGSFDHLRILKVLNLEHNNLKYISETIFAKLSSLTQLSLSHNQLQTAAYEAFPLNLQTLLLDNNQLVNFSVWRLESWTNMKKLSLHENKWSCECQFVERFRSWLTKYLDVVKDTKQIFCVQSDGNQHEMPLIAFNSSLCYNTTAINIHLFDHSDVWKWVLGVFVCLAVTSVLVFYFRREVQVLIYSRLGVRLFYHGEKDELEGKIFDAFIAYSCVDEDFLVNILMPGLERIDEPYKLCLHHRNFLGGASIINSIMEAVQLSTRTIILLSDNFMRSEWCRFEFQQAYIQMLKDRCNRLLVIVIDEVPADLDPEMRLYLRTNTYLKWGDKLFWKKLYFAMPERLETKWAQSGAPRVDVTVNQEIPMQIMG